MGLTVKDEGSNIPMLEMGDYIARCYGVADFGTQQTEYKGQKKDKHQIYVMFELPEIILEDSEGEKFTRTIGKKYTLSLHVESKLRPDLRRWRGKEFTSEELEGFDIMKLIGAPAILEIDHGTYDDKKYAFIDRIKKPKEKVPELTREKMSYSIEENGFVLPEDMPEWMEKIIKQSREWEKNEIKEAIIEGDAPPAASPPIVPIEEDDIPF